MWMVIIIIIIIITPCEFHLTAQNKLIILFVLLIDSHTHQLRMNFI